MRYDFQGWYLGGVSEETRAVVEFDALFFVAGNIGRKVIEMPGCIHPSDAAMQCFSNRFRFLINRQSVDGDAQPIAAQNPCRETILTNGAATSSNAVDAAVGALAPRWTGYGAG